jgi:hypothetical protein
LRSYWDLKFQNRTLKILRDLFGGYFITDFGRNRYLHTDQKPPTPESSGCYLARWQFHNSLIKPKIYVSQRGLDQQNASPKPVGSNVFDEFNPRLFSNNLILPYLIAIWEEYFRESFIALLSYSNQRDKILNKANLNHGQLEVIASNLITAEEAFANSLSFQRPSIIDKNFKILDPKFDLAGILKKPYRGRKKSFFGIIEDYVEYRNLFVHSGQMNLDLSDKKLYTLLSDFEVAVERCYKEFGRRFNFIPNHDY